MQRAILTLGLGLALAACGVSGRGGGPGSDGGRASGDGSSPGGQQGCGELTGCYTVYAHSDHVLYHIDLVSQQLVEVGPFHAPQVSGQEDVITDLAVAPDDTIYTISHTTLYTADATDGHVTTLGQVTACGDYAVALSFTPDGKLYAADYKGAFCTIDLTTRPPTVRQVATLGSGYAIAGDLVAVADGTMYGTAYKLSDSSTGKDNILVEIDPTSGAIAQVIGATGAPNLFGVAFDQGQVFAFTHDGSGRVFTIDPRSGRGTLYGTFTDPSTGKGISFAGAGVNAMVAPTVG